MTYMKILKTIRSIISKKYKYTQNDVLFLAEFMHSNYQYFALRTAWHVQPKTQTDFEDLPEANKKTMLMLAEHLIKCFKIDVSVVCVGYQGKDKSYLSMISKLKKKEVLKKLETYQGKNKKEE